MNPKENHIRIEKSVDQEVEKLIAILHQREEIVGYREVEKQLEKNEEIHAYIELIKEKQKEIVNLQYYEKPRAYQKALKELNGLRKQLDENISVQAYKESLWEANEIVQILFKKMQDAVGEISIEGGGEIAAKNEKHTHDGTILKN